jgi:hypothetical protein
MLKSKAAEFLCISDIGYSSMTRLLISTVRRNTPAYEASGYLYVVDADRQKVMRRCSIVEPAYKELETNPRGGMRGSKGIAVRSDQIAISNSSMIFRFNPEWVFLGVITHPSCSYIHDILFQEDTLWACSAGSDVMIQFDRAGNFLRSLYMRQPSQALMNLQWNPPLLLDEQSIKVGLIDFRNPSTHDRTVFDNAHVNSMGILPDGDILISLGFVIGQKFAAFVRLKMWLIRIRFWPVVLSINDFLRKVFRPKLKNAENTLIVKPATAKSAVIRIRPDGSRQLSLVLKDVTTPSHSLLVLPDATVIYLNTSTGEVLHFNPSSGQILFSKKVDDGFLRGVTSLSDNTLVLGSKTRLLIFDMTHREVASTITLTDDPVESVYDVKVLPPHYTMPPDSFSDHIAQQIGYRTAEEIINFQAGLTI